MYRIKKAVHYILLGFVVSVIVYIASQTVAYYPFLYIQNRVDDSHFKLRFALKGSDGHTTDQIVIVDIDDRSLEKLGDFRRFWPRLYFGRVIGNLKKDGARLIFLDVLLKGVESYTDNKVLADSLKSAGNVFSGFYVNLDSRSKRQHPSDLVYNESFSNLFGSQAVEKVDFLKSERIAFSYHELIMSSERIGFTNYLPDPDGVIRHIPLYIMHRKLLFHSISLEMWQNLKGFNFTDAGITAHGIRFGETFIPADRHCFMRINYQGAEEVYRYVSFVDILNGNFEDGIFKDKIVMIGSSSPKLNDIKKIPGNGALPGVEVHAASLSTLLNENFLNVISGNVTLIFTLLCGIFSSLFFSFTHPVKTGLPFVICVSILLYLYAVYSFLYMSVLINTTIPSCAMILLYGITACSMMYRAGRTKSVQTFI